MEPRGTWLRRAAVVLLAVFGATVALFGVLAALDAAGAPKPRHEYFGTPLRNLAHRGGGANAPEATLPAFAAAAAAGADVLEMDVHLTADDALVVIHDASVDRTTGGSGRVAEMSLAALRTLNAGDRFRAPGGGFPYRDAPIPVPTFAEVLEAHPDLPFVVEMKTAATAEPLCRAIRSAGRESRTLVGAFAQASLDRFREHCPEVATSASFPEVVAFLVLSTLGLPGFYERPPAALFVSERSGPLPVVTPRFLRSARRAGLPVIVWTVNDRADMIRLFDLGVDGILTDDPRMLAEVLAERP